jgi:hypothetical protein
MVVRIGQDYHQKKNQILNAEAHAETESYQEGKLKTEESEARPSCKQSALAIRSDCSDWSTGESFGLLFISIAVGVICTMPFFGNKK